MYLEELKRPQKKAFGSIQLNGKGVVIQGLGAVGYGVCEYLYNAGATLVVSDIKKIRLIE